MKILLDHNHKIWPFVFWGILTLTFLILGMVGE